jgi:uracil-DNA glycosylase family 4
MLDKPSSCSGCPLYEGPFGKTCGFVPASGTGDNGVLVVLEAAGEDEERSGMPVVGKAGQFLWMQLAPLGIEREGFRIHNVLSCRPPENKLVKMPYTEAAIEHCSPNINRTVVDHVSHCRDVNKTPVIVALGKFAFRQLMGISDQHPIMRADYQTYPHWSHRYQSWILAAPHPSHIMQGKNNLVPTLQFVFQRALEIAQDGLVLDNPDYLLDPEPEAFRRFVDGYFEALRAEPENTFLSYDIETPYKSGKSEDEVAREDDDDFVILRCAFSFAPGRACSVRWSPEYMADVERLFSSGGFGVNWNGSTYDDVRIRAQIPFKLVSLDAMLAWHVLNTSLPKGLGFVTPFYVHNTAMWKHLASPPKGTPLEEAARQEAFYNAKDADMALRNWKGIRRDLSTHGLWPIFERHVVQLNKVLSYMSGQGVLLDRDARQEAETKLVGLLAEINERMQAAVPIEARRLKVYKKEPKDVTGLIQTDGTSTVKRCSVCGTLEVKADHFKSIGKKRLKLGEGENPCFGGTSSKVDIPSKLWASALPWKISKLGLNAYQRVMGHKPYKDRKTKQATFDVKAMKQLMVKYPDDPLYPIILQYRKIQKLASTYVGITQYKEVEVDDDYQLKPGEKWATEENLAALLEGGPDAESGWEDQDDLRSQSVDTSVGESGSESAEPPSACEG